MWIGGVSQNNERPPNSSASLSLNCNGYLGIAYYELCCIANLSQVPAIEASRMIWWRLLRLIESWLFIELRSVWSWSADKSIGHVTDLFATSLYFTVMLPNTDHGQSKLRQHHQPLKQLVYSTNYVQTAETGWNAVRGGAVGTRWRWRGLASIIKCIFTWHIT